MPEYMLDLRAKLISNPPDLVIFIVVDRMVRYGCYTRNSHVQSVPLIKLRHSISETNAAHR
jgi:hypothetical protein